MRFDVFSLFPSYFEGPFNSSILKRGREAGLLDLCVHDIRNWTTDRHHVCDDAPYGGGAGMVMKAEPVAAALESVLEFNAGARPPCRVVMMSPQGRPFTQRVAEELSESGRIALLCGHYEGIDERVVDAVVTDEISVGDYVLTGGEAAAAVIVDAVARLVPGVLGNSESHRGDTFSDGLLEAPQYTRPAVWRDRGVPEVLLSGHHAEVEKWRWSEGVRRTLLRRPDLVSDRQWSQAEQVKVDRIKTELYGREAALEEGSDESEFTASG